MGDANQTLSKALEKYKCKVHGQSVVVGGIMPTFRIFGCCDEFIKEMAPILEAEVKRLNGENRTDKDLNN